MQYRYFISFHFTGISSTAGRHGCGVAHILPHAISNLNLILNLNFSYNFNSNFKSQESKLFDATLANARESKLATYNISNETFKTMLSWFERISDVSSVSSDSDDEELPNQCLRKPTSTGHSANVSY